jgi:hypothetical protein
MDEIALRQKLRALRDGDARELTSGLFLDAGSKAAPKWKLCE